MDLPKAFDTINHELLLAKSNAYGFDKNSLQITQDYLSNSWQRTKINTVLVRSLHYLKGQLSGQSYSTYF